MLGKMSVGMVTIAATPRTAIKIDMTTKVYCRRRASLTIHILGYFSLDKSLLNNLDAPLVSRDPIKGRAVEFGYTYMKLLQAVVVGFILFVSALQCQTSSPPIVRFHTNLGDIDVQLLPNLAPNT